MLVGFYLSGCGYVDVVATPASLFFFWFSPLAKLAAN